MSIHIYMPSNKLGHHHVAYQNPTIELLHRACWACRATYSVDLIGPALHSSGETGGVGQQYGNKSWSFGERPAKRGYEKQSVLHG